MPVERDLPMHASMSGSDRAEASIIIKELNSFYSASILPSEETCCVFHHLFRSLGCGFFLHHIRALPTRSLASVLLHVGWSFVKYRARSSSGVQVGSLGCMRSHRGSSPSAFSTPTGDSTDDCIVSVRICAAVESRIRVVAGH